MGQPNAKETPHDFLLYENLKCLICHKLASQAVETSCCHSIYCDSCLTNFKTTNNYCQNCKAGSFEVLPSFLGRKMIDTIPNSCPLKSSQKISVNDLAAHQHTCIKNISSQKQEEEEPEEVLDDAVKAKRFQNTTSRAGRVDGFYVQFGTKNPIKGTFTMKERVVMISTFDAVGPAEWGGEIDLRNLNIQLIKSYKMAHKLYYKGKFNEDVTKLVGAWDWKEIRHNVKNPTFELNFISEEN